MFTNLSGQTKKIDSLKQILSTTNEDTLKIKALMQLCQLTKNKDQKQSIKYAQEGLDLAKKLKSDKNTAAILIELGILYHRTGKLDKATEAYFQALKYFENKNEKWGIGKIYNNLGLIYTNQGNRADAVIYYKKAIAVQQEINDNAGIARSFHNIGISYFENGLYDSALNYFNNSIKIKEKLNDKRGIAASLNLIGDVYRVRKQYDKALSFIMKSLKIKEELKDSMGIANSYSTLGTLYGYQGSFQVAKSYFQKSLHLSKRFNNVINEQDNCLELAHLADTTKDYESAFKYFKRATRISDSLFKLENEKQISELKVQYETEKKDQENQLLKKDQRQKQIINLFLSLIILLMIALVVFIYINRKKLKLAYDKLSVLNVQINQQNEEIQAQADNLQEINSILSDKNTEISLQKAEIEKKNDSITASINYAKRIQSAILPKRELINNLFPAHFILFKPRDVVSGDFYFVKQIKTTILIAAADCTGHGVPGAFMSMLGVAILNELTLKADIQSSAQLLDALRKQIKHSLQQTGQHGEAQDGMDIAFCAINLETMELSFAGAHNPCWIFRSEEVRVKSEELGVKSEEFGVKSEELGSKEAKLLTLNSQLITLEADRQPVGVYIKEKPFAEQIFQLQTGDTIYIFSDGYESQFGGAKKLPMKSKYFKEILSEICILPMETQKQILENKFNEWKGENEQTDDVLVLGVRI